MSARPLLLLTAAAWWLCGPAQGAPLDPAGPDSRLVNPGCLNKPDWCKNSFLDIREDIDEAAADGKR